MPQHHPAAGRIYLAYGSLTSIGISFPGRDQGVAGTDLPVVAALNLPILGTRFMASEG